MKRQFVALLMTAATVTAANHANAQNKIGYISLQELVVAMPEYKTAAKDLEEYQKALEQQSKDIQAEFMNKQTAFNTDSIKWTQSMKEVKRKELNELYIKFNTFVNQEAQQLYNKREQDLLAPVQQKAVQTSQAVAKENGYAYILPKEQLISFPAADDILPMVFKKLNIAAAPAAGAAPKPAGK